MTQNLSEVEVVAQRLNVSLTRLKDYEGTSIYAGKNEVILVEENLGNLASNNANKCLTRFKYLSK